MTIVVTGGLQGYGASMHAAKMSIMDYRRYFHTRASERGFTDAEITDWLTVFRFYADVSPAPETAESVARGDAPAGRLGGLPRLPAGQPWPMVFPPGFTEKWPLEYVGEVDCAGLPETDVAFPDSGKLVFFVDDELISYFVDRESKGPLCRVIYVPAGTETTQLSPPDDDIAVADEQDLYASLRYEFPGWLDWQVDDPVFDDFRQRVPRADALFALATEIWPEGAAEGPRPRELWSGIELGPPQSSPQAVPEESIAAEELAAEHGYASASEFVEAGEWAVQLADARAWQLLMRQEWVSLARFESPENETFFHRFMIHRDDLAQQRFDNVRNFLEH